MKNKFWMWLLHLAYRRVLIAGEKFPDGIPGMRDPEAPCTGYSPRRRRAGDLPAECQTDGHYLCSGCAYKAPAATVAPEKQTWPAIGDVSHDRLIPLLVVYEGRTVLKIDSEGFVSMNERVVGFDAALPKCFPTK